MADDLGVKAAVNELEKQGKVGRPLQGELFDADQKDGQADGAVARGRGRPRGARNKKTAEIIEFIQAKYGDPLENLARIASLSDAELMASGVKQSELVKLRVQCLSGLLPYVHARKTEIKADGIAPLNIVIGEFKAVGGDDEVELVEVITDDHEKDNDNNNLIVTGDENLELSMLEQSKKVERIQEDI